MVPFLRIVSVDEGYLSFTNTVAAVYDVKAVLYFELGSLEGGSVEL